MRPDAGGGDSWAANTNFEQFTHADLIKMMAGSNPQTVTRVGTTLAAASTHMQSLADDLATHINGLVWDGNAGDAFKTWARQVVSATDTLAIFANNTAVAINMAGETLSSTQIPPIPAADQATVNAYKSQFGAQTYIGTDGEAKVAKPLLSTNPVLGGSNASSAITHLVTQESAYQAQTRLDAAHQEAIGQMEKLGGAYVGAKSTLTVSTIPTFPPTPAALMPPQGSGYQSTSGHIGGVNTGANSSGITGGVATTVSGTKNTRKTTSGSTSEGSSGTSTFEPVTSPGSSSGSGSGGGSTSGGSTTLQGVTDPNTTSTSGGSTGGASGNSGGSGGGGTSTVTPIAVGGGGDGANGGSQGSGGSKSGGSGPGSTEGSAPGISGGSSSGGRTGGMTGEPEPGIHGGMPAAAGGRTNSRLSSGVIGAKGEGAGASAFGRGRIGGAAAGVEGSATGGLGGAASVAESAGSSTARSGLGSDVGEGAAAAAGEGGGSGMMPMGAGGMGGAGGSGNGRKRKRATYLTEDEETWTQDVQANPTVIQ